MVVVVVAADGCDDDDDDDDDGCSRVDDVVGVSRLCWAAALGLLALEPRLDDDDCAGGKIARGGAIIGVLVGVIIVVIVDIGDVVEVRW